MTDFNQYHTALNSLVIFRNLLQNPIIKKLQSLLFVCEEAEKGNLPAGDCTAVTAYSEFVSALYQKTDNFSRFLSYFIMEDENFYMRERALGRKFSEAIESCLQAELSMLEKLSSLTSAEVKSKLNYDGFLPDWYNEPCDFISEYQKRIARLPLCGYGIYAKYHVFVWKETGITPVKHPDPQRLSQLHNYERERNLVLQNTLALLEGRPASNTLLYGDAGTGKSSTIKAIANELKDRGLRLIELKKQQLHQLPEILEILSANALKFIIFIDDLSFSGDDDNFSALKAVLEGGVSACGDNIVIYATSNRRHLVKETMADRGSDDLHLNDTLQETMSLAARFGLTITFQKPDKDIYLNIVKHLAKEYQLDLPEDQLFLRAEAHAIRHGGRSPRTAKQFVELTKSGL